MIVRWLRWRATWKQILQLDPQHLHKIVEFKIQDKFQACLDLGKTAPGKYPSRRVAILRPAWIGTTAWRNGFASLEAR